MARTDYTEKDIKVLEGLAAVRRRPGMYIGSTGSRGLHHLVYEIVDNSVDEALAGYCSRIDVRLDPGEVVTIKDDGRGIPTGTHESGIPTTEVIFTKLHAGGKFDSESYKVSGGLHGVGASVVNALSDFFEVESRRDSVIHRQRFERGDETIGPLERLGPTSTCGTTIRFHPDPLIFKTIHFDRTLIARRLQELAYLSAGVKMTLTDARETPQWREAWCYEGGIVAFTEYMNEGRVPVHEPLFFQDAESGIEVACALQYHDGYNESLMSFVNCIHTAEGGQHETGFRSAHTRVMNEYARRYGIWKRKENLSGEDLREGMTAVLSLRMPETEFEGQTKTRLGNPEARTVVDGVVTRRLSAYLEENPDEARKIIDKACRAMQARSAARRAREASRKGKENTGRSSLGGKLTRCSSRKTEETELIIVEGDSAGGSAKQARDRRVQAILPLRGKPLNTERAPLTKVLQNREMLTIIQALGAGVGADFNLDETRYGKVVILADADDDGAHIRCLLLTFLYRHMRPLINAGRVFIAQPPLFKVERGGKRRATVYAWNHEELAAALSKLGKGATIQRFKGLGEMAPGQLWETTLDPATRTLLRVQIEDAAAIDHQVSVLMGDSASLRREWLSKNVSFGVDPLGDATELARNPE